MDCFFAAVQCYENSDKILFSATLEMKNAKKIIEVLCEKNGSSVKNGFARLSGNGCRDFFASLLSSYDTLNAYKCDACGHVNEDGAIFCCKCGKHIGGDF